MGVAKELFEIFTSSKSETLTGFLLILGGIEEAIRSNSILPATAALIGFALMLHSADREGRGPSIGG